MKKDKLKVETDVAWLCTGKDKSCTKDNCYYKNHGACVHTTNAKYARNGPIDPKKHPEKFDKYSVELYGIRRVRYYERSSQNDQ